MGYREPDFITAITAQHHAREDALDAQAERLADLRDELTNDMSRALSGLQSWVPSTVLRQPDMKPVERISSAADETLCALDNMTACEALMRVLRVSECPHVAALRKSVIAAYVSQNAHFVAEARGL